MEISGAVPEEEFKMIIDAEEDGRASMKKD
jgi:hypothetical protein